MSYLLAHKAGKLGAENITSPVAARLIKEVYNIKVVGVFFLQRIQFFSEKDILFGDIRE